VQSLYQSLLYEYDYEVEQAWVGVGPGTATHTCSTGVSVSGRTACQSFNAVESFNAGMPLPGQKGPRVQQRRAAAAMGGAAGGGARLFVAGPAGCREGACALWRTWQAARPQRTPPFSTDALHHARTGKVGPSSGSNRLVTPSPLQVEGTIPSDLVGTYVRNGPGLQVNSGKTKRHTFDGQRLAGRCCASRAQLARGSCQIGVANNAVWSGGPWLMLGRPFNLAAPAAARPSAVTPPSFCRAAAHPSVRPARRTSRS
jgi:hypothetical protein